MQGLESDLSSFLFKLLHKLLPTQDRVSRIVRAEAQILGLCQLCHREVEDTSLALTTELLVLACWDLYKVYALIYNKKMFSNYTWVKTFLQMMSLLSCTW